MSQTTPQPLDQPSLGSEFERPTLAQLIDREIAKGPNGLTDRIAQITEKFFSEDKERKRLDRSAQCPKCGERTGSEVHKSSWVDNGKYRERICLNARCNHFFRTFEKFPEY